ncbi:MAG: hypothetical protein GF329_13660 [Candidatus Lokiarchaeota archaeon]|nr:hypothetical protein [Candidatus Lokiarchaeota archaeon]
MDVQDQEEREEFLKGVRKYVFIRHLITYIIVFGSGTLSGWFLYIFLYRLYGEFYNIIWFILFSILFIILINIVLQQFLSFYHLPKHILDILDRTGFEIIRNRRFLFFYNTKLKPTPNSWIKVGIKASYFPLTELRYESYRIRILSSKLCSSNDPLYNAMIKKITEKNLLSLSNLNENKLITYRKSSSGLRINIECSPEELLSRLMIVGKAIREWESAINRLAEYSIKPNN